MFVADENIDSAIVRRLRDDGHDVVWIAESEPGITDDRVVQLELLPRHLAHPRRHRRRRPARPASCGASRSSATPAPLILLDDPHLVPTPFEADPPDPILLVPDGLTRFDDDVLRALRLRLRRAPGAPATIRWHTFGMPGALAEDDARHRPWRGRWRNPVQRVLWARERMSRRAGFICYTAPPEILRAHALGIYRMHAYREGYHPLAEHGARQTWGYE